jgi:hypothetical protein
MSREFRSQELGATLRLARVKIRRRELLTPDSWLLNSSERVHLRSLLRFCRV